MKGKSKYTLENVIEIFKKYNIEFIDDTFQHTRFKHKFKCLKCDYIWRARFDSVRNKLRCPKCARNKKTENEKYSLEEVKEIFYKNNIEFLDDFYKNRNFKHNAKCLKCEHKWKIKLGNVFKKINCPLCGQIKKWNLKDILWRK